MGLFGLFIHYMVINKRKNYKSLSFGSLYFMLSISNTSSSQVTSRGLPVTCVSPIGTKEYSLRVNPFSRAIILIDVYYLMAFNIKLFNVKINYLI